MKKSIAVILTLVIALTAILAACKKPEENTESTESTTSTTYAGIENADTEIGFEDIEVTDEQGVTVTDKSGTVVTTEVAVVYTRNQSGQVIGKVLDDSGDVVTKQGGEEVTIIVNPETTTAGADDTTKKGDDKTTTSGKSDDGSTTKGGSSGDTTTTKGGNENPSGKEDESSSKENPSGKEDESSSQENPSGEEPASDEETTEKTTEKETTTKKPPKTTESTTNTTKKGDDTTATTAEDETTTKQITGVPKTTDSGKGCEFSSEDQQIIKHMLEVPYLYKASYEHEDGVPINIATHAALWMLQKDGLQTTSYASGTVVIDLFKYFGRTVVGFKAKCNSEGDCANIQYNASSDVFNITEFEAEAYDVSSTHTVNKLRFEDLGNNYFKVTADVDGVKGIKTVTAIVEKNRLDNDLGFSIKALNWSKK